MPAAAAAAAVGARRRQFECQELMVRVQDDVNQEPLPSQLRRESDAMRMRSPVRLSQPDAVPRFAGLRDQLIEAHPPALVLEVATKPSRAKQLNESM